MEKIFYAIREAQPGEMWQNIFYERWPAYQKWINSSEAKIVADTRTSIRALKEYMPEMVSTHQKLCHLVNANEEAIRFLTGFQPPPYYSACSQAVSKSETLQLIRNYDYHPMQLEASLFHTEWNGKKVMVNSDSLIGAIDGINQDGLAVSITFGGRKVVGPGFGIPFIMRYVLEFCINVKEAVEVLKWVPSHMSYNVTLVDKSGNFKTVLVAPDRHAIVQDSAFATNHQNKIEWPENALFNQTFERSNYIEKLLNDKSLTDQKLSEAFLNKPLYHNHFEQGLGTIYTAIYKPQEGSLEMLWPEGSLKQSIHHFQEGSIKINFEQAEVEKISKTRRTKKFTTL